MLLALAPVETATRLIGRQPEPEHVVLLVKDAQGYANLLQLMATLEAEPGGPAQVALVPRATRG